MPRPMAFGLALAIALAAPLAAQETADAPAAAPETAFVPPTPQARMRNPRLQRIALPDAKRRGLEQEPAVRDLGVGRYRACRPLVTPFGPTALEACRPILLLCDDAGACVEP